MKPHNDAAIVDCDGTLVDVKTVRHHVLRRPKNFDAFHRGARHCPPNRQAIEWCENQHLAGRTILVVTARKYEWEQSTRDWLFENMTVPFVGPFMRGDLDNRPDTDVKRSIHDVLTGHPHNYNIRACLDDNPLIVELWKSLGYPTDVVPGWDNETTLHH